MRTGHLYPALLLLLTGCWEIPPRLPEPAVLAHAPRAVWFPDPFAAPNRLYQRLFGVPSDDGRIVVDPARPLPPRERFATLGAADHAELFALIERAAEALPADARAASVMQCDLLAAAALLAAVAEDDERCAELTAALVRLAERLAPGEASDAGEWTIPDLPRELDGGAWEERETPLPASLLPHGDDLRWTRVVAAVGVEGDSSAKRFLVLRLGVGLDADGDAHLLDLASECRLVRGGEKATVLRVWHHDREAAFRGGEDAWREVALESPAERAWQASEPLVAATSREDQRALATRVIEELKGSGGAAR